MLLGLLRPSTGQALLAGSPPNRVGRRKLGYVPQGLGLYAELTVGENLAFAAQAFGCQPAELPPVLADDADTLVGGLPLGLRRQVAFLCALQHSPDVLVLDEPTSGVEPLSRARLWDRIRAESSRGVGVLVTLLTTVGLARPWQIWLYAGSFLGFLATIGIALVIYQKNAELIENDFRGDVKDLKLKAFDIASIVTFYVGAIFAVLIAISSALTQPTKKGDYGMGETMKKSLDGISNLKPQLPHEPPPAAPSAQQSQATTTPVPVADSPKK